MAKNTTPGTGPEQAPLEKGSHLVSDILYFFGHRLPGMFSQGLESRTLFEKLSRLDDASLERLGIPRSEIPAYVADKMDIFPSRDRKTANGSRH